MRIEDKGKQPSDASVVDGTSQDYFRSMVSEDYWARIINNVLEKAGRPERFHLIKEGRETVAGGIWNEEKTSLVIRGLIVKPGILDDFTTVGDNDGEFGGEGIGEFWFSFIAPKDLVNVLTTGDGKCFIKTSGEEGAYFLEYPEGDGCQRLHPLFGEEDDGRRNDLVKMEVSPMDEDNVKVKLSVVLNLTD